MSSWSNSLCCCCCSGLKTRLSIGSAVHAGTPLRQDEVQPPPTSGAASQRRFSYRSTHRVVPHSRSVSVDPRGQSVTLQIRAKAKSFAFDSRRGSNQGEKPFEEVLNEKPEVIHIPGLRVTYTGSLKPVVNPDVEQVFESFRNQTVSIVFCGEASSNFGVFIADIAPHSRVREATRLVFEMEKATEEVSPEFVNGSLNLKYITDGEAAWIEGSSALPARKGGKAAENAAKKKNDSQSYTSRFNPHYQGLYRPNFKAFDIFQLERKDTSPVYVLSAKTDFPSQVYGSQDRAKGSKTRILQMFHLHILPSSCIERHWENPTQRVTRVKVDRGGGGSE